MQIFYRYVVVFFGAGIGGAVRHSVNLACLRLFGPDLHVATLVVNVAGSLAIGVIAGHFAMKGHASQAVQLFLATGILGGFTTFSAFSLEAALFWQRGQLVTCVVYVLSSVLLSITGVFAGLALAGGHHSV